MSTRPRIFCPHCEARFDASMLAANHKYRNKYGIDVFGCPECLKSIKIDPREYLFASQQLQKDEMPNGVTIGAVSEAEVLPSEQIAIDEGGTRSNRHVPIIVGAISIVGALLFIFYFTGWWKFFPATLLIAIGWASLKTGLFASNREIAELTGDAPVSGDTAGKFKDRV